MMTDTLHEQILAISELGNVDITNPTAVKKAAQKSGYQELVDFIESDNHAYRVFILTGELP